MQICSNSLFSHPKNDWKPWRFCQAMSATWICNMFWWNPQKFHLHMEKRNRSHSPKFANHQTFLTLELSKCRKSGCTSTQVLCSHYVVYFVWPWFWLEQSQNKSLARAELVQDFKLANYYNVYTIFYMSVWLWGKIYWKCFWWPGFVTLCQSLHNLFSSTLAGGDLALAEF